MSELEHGAGCDCKNYPVTRLGTNYLLDIIQELLEKHTHIEIDLSEPLMSIECEQMGLIMPPEQDEDVMNEACKSVWNYTQWMHEKRGYGKSKERLITIRAT